MVSTATPRGASFATINRRERTRRRRPQRGPGSDEAARVSDGTTCGGAFSNSSTDKVSANLPMQAYGNHGEVDIYRLINNVYTPTRLDRGSFTTIASAEVDDSGNLLVVRGYAGDQHSIASYQWSNRAWVNTSTVALANDGSHFNVFSFID